MAHVTAAGQELVEHRAPTDTIEVEPTIEKPEVAVAVLALWTEPETETGMTLGCVIRTGNYTAGSIFGGKGVFLIFTRAYVESPSEQASSHSAFDV